MAHHKLLARPIPGGDWTLSLCVWLHRHFFSGLPCSTFSTPPASCAPEQPGGTRRAHVAPFSSHGTRRLPYIRHACLEGQITTINQNGSKLVAHLRRRATYTYARKFRIHIHTGELVGYTSHSQVVASFKLESCYLKVVPPRRTSSQFFDGSTLFRLPQHGYQRHSLSFAPKKR